MEKIVYIFGAGASKQALPIINEIPNRLSILIKKLELKDFELSDNEKFDLQLEDIKFKNLIK
ncbi:MAG: hypothetical protein R6V04_13650 [bacterium]